jgi:hypothetical protein
MYKVAQYSRGSQLDLLQEPAIGKSHVLNAKIHEMNVPLGFD